MPVLRGRPADPPDRPRQDVGPDGNERPDAATARGEDPDITQVPEQPPKDSGRSSRAPGPPDDTRDEGRAGLWDRLGDRWATAATAAAAGLVLLGVLLGMAMLTDGVAVTPSGAGRTGEDTSSASPATREPRPERPVAPGTPPATAAPSASTRPTAPQTGGDLPEKGVGHDDDDDDEPDEDDDEDDDDEDDDTDDDEDH